MSSATTGTDDDCARLIETLAAMDWGDLKRQLQPSKLYQRGGRYKWEPVVANAFQDWVTRALVERQQ